ncbi:MAG: NAD-dependent deacylase [Patescibacteria group bacterium]
MQEQDPIVEARAVLASAKRILILTGAGISAESGVPTFRGEGGYWRNKSFEELASPVTFKRDPRLVWDWYLMRRQTVSGCRPNAAHRAMADWSEIARWTRDVQLITQNVDGLHESAGHTDVIRLHGSLWRNQCTKCGQEREEKSLNYERLPVSPCCGALERPAIVWFGEALPIKPMAMAYRTCLACEAVLVVGTSGIVMPAASLVSRAKERGSIVIDVNPEDDAVSAHIKLRGPAATLVPAILA